MVSLPLDMLQSHLPHITDQNHSKEADLAQGADPIPDKAVTTAEQRGLFQFNI